MSFFVVVRVPVEHLYVAVSFWLAELSSGGLAALGLVKLVNDIRPKEIYNLAAMSHVAVSFDMAEYTGNVDGLGTLRLLDAIRIAG